MNISQLEYLLEVARVGNISVASQNLFVSQAGISQAITSLEEELGTKIFKRSRAGAILTEHGKQIVTKAEEVLAKVQELKEFSTLPNTKNQEEIKLALTPGVYPVLLKNLSWYKSKYPDVLIKINEGESMALHEDIKTFKSDIGVIGTYKYSNLNTSDIFFEEIFKTKIKILVSKNSPFASVGKMTPQEFVNQPVVLYNSQTFLNFLKPFKSKFGDVKDLFISNNLDTVKNLIIEEDAVSLFTEVFLKTDPDILKGNLIPITLTNYDQDYISYGIVYSRKKNQSTAFKQLVEFLKEELVVFC
ncbi:DNA-binding transcriptional LysR family regulator [Bacillus niacini]|uniref:DNA-binding transcriptional LysR family regulator n=1 Tax=Neobacillus niacini TaxID=86668 RepID=A0A852T8U5_9BACI|nr:LysR family transcriptional regulator [Neobacillus niacini]NYE04269.1 DNA-binding transcriptional LysR family regulator [Neobacillus niacini]